MKYSIQTRLQVYFTVTYDRKFSDFLLRTAYATPIVVLISRATVIAEARTLILVPPARLRGNNRASARLAGLSYWLFAVHTP